MIEEQKKFSAEASPAAKREADRDSLLLKAVLRLPASKEEREVRIKNLSAGGLMAEAPLQIARGEKIELKLRNIGWLAGTVAWVAESRIGIAFDHPIDPKNARKPVGTSKDDEDMPLYLKKLNKQQQDSQKNLRRL